MTDGPRLSWLLLAAALVAAAGLGLLLGLYLRAGAASRAELHARSVDSLYRAHVAADVYDLRRRTADSVIRVAALHTADSLTGAADDSIRQVRASSASADRAAAARLAAAHTLLEERDAYRTSYQDAIRDRDTALRAAEDQRRALGHLRAIIAADSGTIARADQRGDRWKSTADSLDRANADLLRHRRGITLSGLGLGSAGTAVAVIVVCSLIQHPC